MSSLCCTAINIKNLNPTTKCKIGHGKIPTFTVREWVLIKEGALTSDNSSRHRGLKCNCRFFLI